MGYHLRLTKALSYCGIVSATRKQPDVIVEDKTIADAVVASGYFRLVGDTVDVTEEVRWNKEEKEPGKRLEEMTVPELETFATYKGISLKGISKKTDILTKLKEELGEEEMENEVDYGSPTITELQE